MEDKIKQMEDSDYKLSDEELKEIEDEIDRGYCDLTHLGKLSKFKNLGILDQKIFDKMVSEGWNPITLEAISENGWQAIYKFDIFEKETLKDLYKSVMYECPFNSLEEKREYIGSIPICILTKEDPMKLEGSATEWTRKFASDVKFWGLEKFLEVTGITKALNGHGYDDGCIPSDGSGSWILIGLEIKKDVIVIFRTWDWYNK